MKKINDFNSYGELVPSLATDTLLVIDGHAEFDGVDDCFSLFIHELDRDEICGTFVTKQEMKRISKHIKRLLKEVED